MAVKRDTRAGITTSIPRRESARLPEVVAEDGGSFPSWKRVSSAYGDPVHRMMARLGSFPPALARYLILGYSRPRDTVLDPFCGKGTTIVEAVLAGRAAIGSDVAPDAVVATRAKISGVVTGRIKRYLGRMARDLTAESELPHVGVPEDVRLFYHPQTLAQLLQVRRWLLARSTGSRSAQFLLGCLLGILHGKSSISLSLPSAHAYAMAPAYVRKYAAQHQLTAPPRDVLQCLEAKALGCISSGRAPAGNAHVYLSSAENYSFHRYHSLDRSVDLIVTSPPYLNAQTYAKDAWLRLWLLGRDYRDLLPQFIATGSVGTYRQRMSVCLQQMLRVLKPEGHAFLVAGDATTRIGNRPVVVRTAEILGEVASELAQYGFRFRVVEIIDDYVLPHSRYLFPVHRNGKSQASLQPKQERILHLVKVAGPLPPH